MLERNYLTRSCNIYIEQRDESRADRHTEKKIARVVDDARWKAETKKKERERESGDTIRLIVGKSELGGVFDRNQFGWVQATSDISDELLRGMEPGSGKNGR